MDLTDLIAETRERLGETEADFFTDAEITRALNEGLRRFSNEERWPWLYTEFEGTPDTDEGLMPLPTDVAINRTFALTILDTSVIVGPIERVTPMEGFKLRFVNRDRTGPPRWYYVSHTNLNDDGAPPLTYQARFIPVPDMEYTINGLYLMVPLELSGASDEPAMPVEYQMALPAYAAGLLYLKELMIAAKATEQFNMYASILQNAVRETKRFDEDEIVAWGRNKPAGSRYNQWPTPYDVLSRIAPTVG